jgi:hypothetical protein
MRTRLRTAVLAGIVVAGTVAVPATAQAIAGGDPVAAGSDRYVAKISLATAACTGVLVAPQWVATAASCFPAADIAQGRPGSATTVVVGQPDLTSANHLIGVTALVGRPDRNLVLAKLTYAVNDVTPLPLGTAAPTAADTVRIDGFGRTASEWVPNRLSTTPQTIGAVTATTITLSGAHDPCKGDAGGPVLRSVGGRTELAGLITVSWGHGCLSETETRSGSVAVRTDDIAGWITQQTAPTALRFVNRNSQRCLAVQGANNVNDAPAFQFDCPPAYDDQAWQLQTTAGGTMIKNAYTGRCLIVHAGAGPQVVQFDCLPQFGDQFWDIVPLLNGVQVRNKATNLCLSIGDVPNGAPATQVACDATHAEQTWDEKAVPDQLRVVNRASKQCLAVHADNNVNDAPAFQFDCTPRYADQVWELDPAGDSGYLVRNHATKRCLIVHGGGGDQAVQFDCLPQFGDQFWDTITVGDAIQLRNKATGRCLGIASGLAVQAPCNVTNADQVWEISPF